MQIINNLLKKAILHSRNADQKAIFIRWVTLAVFLVFFWAFSALVISPFLFSLSNDVFSESANISDSSLQFISLFFNPPVLLLVFTFLTGSLLAYQFVDDYFVSLHGKTNRKYSKLTLWKRVFGIPKNELTRIGDLKQERNNLQLLNIIGGPARIVVPAENTVLLEDHIHQVQIIGPTMNLPGNHYLMNNFVKLRDVINLQNQSIQLNVKIQTKDGQQLLIKNLRAIFSVYRDVKTTTLTRPYPFSTESIFTLYYSIAPGSLQDKFGDILKCGLIHFARQFESSELLRERNNPLIITGKIRLQNELHSVFKKRQKFSAIIRKPIFSFFQNHIQKKTWFLQRRAKKIRRLYLDTIITAEIRTNMLEENKYNFSDFIKNFETYISPHLEKKGFQLHLLSYGTFEIEKRNEKINLLNELNENEAHRLDNHFQDQITQLLKEMNESSSIFADKGLKKDNLKKIRTLLESSLETKKGKLNFHDRQLEKAIESIDQMIKSQD